MGGWLERDCSIGLEGDLLHLPFRQLVRLLLFLCLEIWEDLGPWLFLQRNDTSERSTHSLSLFNLLSLSLSLSLSSSSSLTLSLFPFSSLTLSSTPDHQQQRTLERFSGRAKNHSIVFLTFEQLFNATPPAKLHFVAQMAKAFNFNRNLDVMRRFSWIIFRWQKQFTTNHFHFALPNKLLVNVCVEETSSAYFSSGKKYFGNETLCLQKLVSNVLTDRLFTWN